MTPSINVNLKRCVCAYGFTTRSTHAFYCPSSPILIPCALPRAVTFSVVLGNCDCFYRGPDGSAEPPPSWTHTSVCASRPVRVSCSISGTTWEESEVTDVEMVADADGAWTRDNLKHIEAACRDRWALVKALVLPLVPVATITQADRIPGALLLQRDAMFAALADMARAEIVHTAKLRVVVKALSDAGASWSTSIRVTPPASESALADYVERLVEQVGAL